LKSEFCLNSKSELTSFLAVKSHIMHYEDQLINADMEIILHQRIA